MRAWVRCIRTPLAEPPGPFVLQHNHSGALGTQNMKKTLTVLAVMAIAAAAHADITGTWASWTTNKATGSDYLTVSDLKAWNSSMQNNTASQKDIFNVNGMNGDVNGGIAFTYTVAENYQIVDAAMVGQARVTKAGPIEYNWYLGSTLEGGPTSATGGNIKFAGTGAETGKVLDSSNSSLGDLSGSGAVFLIADASKGRAGAGTGAPSGNFAFTGSGDTALQLQGTLKEASAVPEPATMSLLGLGALAIALRRKLRK